MKVIQLYPTGSTIVDDDDYVFLQHFRWRLSKTGYAYYTTGGSLKQKSVYIHRMIMEPCEPFVVDHIDGDKLNNQKKNLRLVLHHENAWNRFESFKKNSKYYGVGFDKKNKAWTCNYSTREKKHIYLGRFNTELEAAVAYDIASEAYWKELARLNFPKNRPLITPKRRGIGRRGLTSKIVVVHPDKPYLEARIRVYGGTAEEQREYLKTFLKP